jgi:hypothetical protein
LPIERVAEEERDAEHENDQAGVLKPASPDVGFEVDGGRLQRWRRDVQFRTGGGHDRALGLGLRLGHNPAIRRFVHHWSGRRRSAPRLEPFDPVRETPEVSLETEGANESDDGDEDPDEDDQRREYLEHSVLDEMLARNGTARAFTARERFSWRRAYPSVIPSIRPYSSAILASR